MPVEITQITNAIGTVQQYIVTIATALVVLMISIAGFTIIMDRDAATTKRGERLAFIRSILLGYGIILGANLLIFLLINVMTTISGHAAPTAPTIHHN
jgi:hypothetical protein